MKPLIFILLTIGLFSCKTDPVNVYYENGGDEPRALTVTVKHFHTKFIVKGDSLVPGVEVKAYEKETDREFDEYWVKIDST
ncbi:MAG: hypothetical protein IH946_00195, partial [Bacteroidetes bacterium]|nr:hypothetical protein [Bacteroidota bacterium]